MLLQNIIKDGNEKKYLIGDKKSVEKIRSPIWDLFIWQFSLLYFLDSFIRTVINFLVNNEHDKDEVKYIEMVINLIW